jgi:hypothetical protein
LVNHIYAARLLDEKDLARMDELLTRLTRLRDSWLPEVIIVLLVAVRTVFIFETQLSQYPWMTYGTGNDIHLTLTGWYALLVSAPILQFLVGLTLWKWLLWTVFAFRLSKFNLRVVPTHPDENGGLGFLGMTPLAFAPLAFATTIVIGATFRHQILDEGARLNHFLLPAIVVAVIFALMALGPLAFFVPRWRPRAAKGSWTTPSWGKSRAPTSTTTSGSFACLAATRSLWAPLKSARFATMARPTRKSRT